MPVVRIRLHPQMAALLLLAGVTVFTGCESSANLATYFQPQERDSYQDEDRHRRKYQGTRDQASMRWLLSHRIRSGMTYQEVCGVLGEEGMREYNDNWLKTKGGNYRVDDVAYKFGPDDRGQSLYLVFREDALVNFDADAFRGAGPKLAALEEDEDADE